MIVVDASAMRCIAFCHSLAETSGCAPGRKAVAPAPVCEQRIGQMRFYKKAVAQNDFRGVDKVKWAK
jgi:hypothetical protein